MKDLAEQIDKIAKNQKISTGTYRTLVLTKEAEKELLALIESEKRKAVESFAAKFQTEFIKEFETNSWNVTVVFLHQLLNSYFNEYKAADNDKEGVGE